MSGAEARRLPTLYVDADACPVKDEVLRVAGRKGLVTVFVSNGGIRPSRDPMVRVIVVPQGADAADDWIVAAAKPGDVVVTADVPLAHRIVTLGAYAIGPTGRLFTEDSVGMALAMRDLKQQLREAGEIRGFNPAFGPKDRSAFLVALDRLVEKINFLRAKNY